MIYSGTITSVQGIEYKVTIDTHDGNSAATEILFADDNPITLTMADDEDIFKPIKYLGGTLTLVSSTYYPNLATTSYTTSVEVYDVTNDEYVFVGYLTPEVYNQDFVRPWEVIDLNIVDGLTPLKYKDYTVISTSGRSDFWNVTAIIYNILSKTNYRGFSLPWNLDDGNQENPQGTARIYRDICLNEANFFDEDGKAMKCDEVLTEICRYFGMTCFASENAVNFVSYESIKSGNNHYSYYPLTGTTIDNFVQQESSYNAYPYTYSTINKNALRGEDTQISIGEWYNKFTVNADFYSVDVLADIFETATKNTSNLDANQNFEERGNLNVVYPYNSGDKEGYWILTKYYDVKDVDLYNYDGKPAYSWLEFTDTEQYDYVHNVEFIRQQVQPTTASTPYDSITTFQANVSTPYIGMHGARSTTFNASNDIRFTIHSSHNNLFTYQHSILINFSLTAQEPVFAFYAKNGEIVTNKTGGQTIAVGSDGYAPIKDKAYPLDYFLTDITSVRIKLQVINDTGDYNKYWDGRTWTDQPSYFDLPLDVADDGKSAKVENNIHYYDNIDGEGWQIKMDEGMYGRVALTVYAPGVYNHPWDCAFLLKDFEFKVLTTLDREDSDNEDNSIYTVNVNGETELNEYEEIECKITTWDDKKHNLSSPVIAEQDTHNVFEYVGKLYNVNDNTLIRPEEHILRRYASQYSSPYLLVEGSVSYLPYLNHLYRLNYMGTGFDSTKEFLINGFDYDVKLGAATLKLVELQPLLTTDLNFQMYNQEKQYRRNHTIAFKKQTNNEK